MQFLGPENMAANSETVEKPDLRFLFFGDSIYQPLDIFQTGFQLKTAYQSSFDCFWM
jgi:hypothetical protein